MGTNYPQHYKNYIGAYGKRFYRPFEKEYIFKILDYRVRTMKGIMNEHCVIPEFLLEDGMDWSDDPNNIHSDPRGSWYDCEDTCIITNELPVLKIDWVANVNDSDYEKEYFNPFL